MNPNSDEGHKNFFEIREVLGLKPWVFHPYVSVFLALKGEVIGRGIIFVRKMRS
jgi:hypothetical protein